MTRKELQAFTLTELLVVISVIVILAGLIMGPVTGAVNKSRQTHCLNNLRNIGMALQEYQKDFEMLPSAQNMPSLGLNTLPSISEALAPCVDDTNIFHCLSDDEYFEREGTSYEWNDMLNGKKGELRMHHGFTLDPSEVRALWDYMPFHGEEGEKASRNILYMDNRAKSF